MTTLATPEATLRIGIEAAVPTVTILMPGGGDLVDEKNRRVKSFRSGERFSWSVSQETPPSKKQDRRASRKKSVFSSLAGRSMRFQPKQGTLSLNGRAYRGVLEVSFGRSGATVVNLVGMEDYVKGVVGSEIGSLSPKKASRPRPSSPAPLPSRAEANTRKTGTIYATGNTARCMAG
ncbi:MAG TPA: SpoIID/LytB domain-containing protein, partial [Candidatus Ozemobacteraceae bacterium]|nr:SpoIID/LytB domain-containing protein [Candidatus Ozemobacteraceae bacterium]